MFVDFLNFKNLIYFKIPQSAPISVPQGQSTQIESAAMDNKGTIRCKNLIQELSQRDPNYSF